MIRLSLTGRTYAMKEQLKASGFRWDGTNKNWYKLFEDEESELVTRLADAYEDGTGITCCVKVVGNPDEKKYFVKESWIFNLESMHDKLWVIENAIQTGELQFPFQLAGKNIKDYNDLEDLRHESYELEDKAKRGKVTGLQYGRIKAIVAWRVEQRYNACMAAGMNERDAGRCFEDM